MAKKRGAAIYERGTHDSSWRQRLKPDISLLAVASCNLGLNVLMGLFNFYYVKVFLEHYHISQNWLYYGQIFFIIANFFTGPVLAYAQDYGPKMFRNHRRMVLFAGPLFAASFMLPWFPWYKVNGKDDETYWPPGVHLMVVMLLWNSLYFVINACNCSLFAELSTDQSHRVKALTYNQIASCLAACAVFPIDYLSKSLRDFRTFQICCGAIAILAGACFIFTGLKASDEVAQNGTGNGDKSDNEGSGDDKNVHHSKSESSEVKKSIKTYFTVLHQLFSNRNFLCTLIANFMLFFRVCVSQNFLAVYTEGLISKDVLPPGTVLIAIYYLAAQLTPRLIFSALCQVIKVFGPKKTVLTTLALAWVNTTIGLIVGSLVSYNVMIGILLNECVLVIFQDACVMFYSEVIDEDTKKHKRGMPVSPTVFTMSSLFLQPSTALAPMLIVAALNVADYDKYKTNIGAAPSETKTVMFFVANCVPTIAAFISFLSMCFYKHKCSEENDNTKKIISHS